MGPGDTRARIYYMGHRGSGEKEGMTAIGRRTSRKQGRRKRKEEGRGGGRRKRGKRNEETGREGRLNSTRGQCLESEIGPNQFEADKTRVVVSSEVFCLMNDIVPNEFSY